MLLEQLMRLEVVRKVSEMVELDDEDALELLESIGQDEPSLAQRARVLSLDGRVSLEDVDDSTARDRMKGWIDAQRTRLNITAPLKGAVFEVRQGYKSADSKRQNADLANAAQALGHGFLPVLTIMSTQINEVVHARYTTGNWSVLMGTVGQGDSLRSTYDFVDRVVGYDLAGFFERNTSRLRSGVEDILRALLGAK